MSRHPAELPLPDLVAQCEFATTRRRGPGGQHRNKVETAVVATHRPTGVRAEASERRSQQANRQQALFRLRIRLALKVRTPRGEVRSERWQRRLAGRRLVVNPEHDDFPALLAECLDVAEQVADDLAAAAQRCGVTTSQLCKFLKKEPAAWEQVNTQRRQRGLPRLR